MWLVKAEIRESAIDRCGVFATEPIRAGQILSVWRRLRIMPEEHYNDRCREPGELRRSCVRLIGRHYAHEEGGSHPDDFMNHSPHPNVLYHLGVMIALTDVSDGEELTVDYNNYFSADSCEPFADRTTGTRVEGVSPRDALMRACESMLALLRANPAWDGT